MKAVLGETMMNWINSPMLYLMLNNEITPLHTWS